MSRVSSPAHSRRGSATGGGVPGAGMSGRGAGIGGAATAPRTGAGAAEAGGTMRPQPGLTTRASTSSTPRVASPAPPPATPRDVSRLIGTKVRLTLTGGDEGERAVEGEVWCYDAITGVVVLETPSAETATGSTTGSGPSDKKDYRLVKVNQVKAIDILGTGPAPSSSENADPTAQGVEAILAPLKPVNIAAVQAREAKAVKAEDERRARVGVGVSRWAQEIFDALGRTLPVRWHQSSIIIMDEVVLSGPLYRAEDVRAGAGGHGRLDRVRQVLEGERARLLRTDHGQGWEAEARATAAGPAG